MKQQIFVAMPYGERTGMLNPADPRSKKKIDFSKVWSDILKPALPREFECYKAEDSGESGSIDGQYIRSILNAQIVLADLTFANPNVYFELGIRYALAKSGTVLVACRGTALPFDIRQQKVLEYDFFAATGLLEFQRKLSDAVANVAKGKIDSPVYVFIPELRLSLEGATPSAKVAAANQFNVAWLLPKIAEANNRGALLRVFGSIPSIESLPIEVADPLATKLRKFGCFDEAIKILEAALQDYPGNSELLREAGFAYRKKGVKFYQTAEELLERALRINERDAECHGMLGGLLKRRDQFTDALAHYLRAFEIDPDNSYSLVNLGGMYAVMKNSEESKLWYEKLLGNCRLEIDRGQATYWTYFCLGEAAVGLNDEATALVAYQRGIEMHPPSEDVASPAEQLHFFVRQAFAAELSKKCLKILEKE